MDVTRDGTSVDHARQPQTASQCESVAPVLARIGDKWSMLVVMLLGPGPRRFNDLKRSVDGISQRMLSLTLRRLERDGLVDRAVTPTIPPRVDYALTELGQSLRSVVATLAVWARDNHDLITAAHRRYEQRHELGHEAGHELSHDKQVYADEGLAGDAVSGRSVI